MGFQPGQMIISTCASAVSFITTNTANWNASIEKQLFYGAERVKTGVEWLESRVNEIIDKAWN